MGIPYYFYSLTQKYSNIISSDISNDTDIYCIDFNGLIHPIAQEVIKSYDENIEEKIIEKLWDKICYYIDTFKPKEIIICTDGVAPLAKMIQQRKRRYLTIYRNKLDNVSIKWDTNAITPGTEFMTKLNLYIKTKVRYNSTDVIINYSGSDEAGEGEHKIFQKLALEDVNYKIIINGLDADLIILSLLSGKKNIYLMREMDSNNTTFLNILELRKAIIKELINTWSLDSNLYDDVFNENSINLIESYCVACSIMGNDFIPHLLTLNLKTNGLDKLIIACKYAIANYGMLVQNNKINYNTLCDIFTELSKKEDSEIFKECENYIKKNINGKNDIPSDLYGLKNKDKLVNTIYNNPIKWRVEYYKSIFNANIIQDSNIITTSVISYIKGIYWTYEYYKRRDIDHFWFYPYNYPPSIKDISNNGLAINTNIFNEYNKNGTFVNSNIQMLIVLPKESKHLLNYKNKKYMEDIAFGLYHMYPDKYDIQTFLKTHLWECSPILPNINLNYILKIVNE